MSNSMDEKLGEIFRAILKLDANDDVTQIGQAVTPAWDSLAHVSLVGAIESEFGATIDIEDALELTSYDAIRQYLQEHAR